MTHETIDALHRAAVAADEQTYRDPNSGLRVFTSVAHLRRGRCCGCGCRHCPYGHRDVAPEQRAALRRDPWVEGPVPPAHGVDVCFWSGGKDSYLALRRLDKPPGRARVLLTTFDGESEVVAHQEVSIEIVRAQARALRLPLLLVPLYAGSEYRARLALAIALLERLAPVRRLVFGDLHLQHIRAWREDAFAATGIELAFPLWGAGYDGLFAELSASPVTCRISAVASEALAGRVRVGDPYDGELIRRLPSEVDHFGEQGEFHTAVTIDRTHEPL